MRRFAGRLLRRGVRQMKKIIERLDPPPVPYNSINPRLAYKSLNDALIELTNGNTVYYPPYTMGVLHAAHLARTLGIDRISVIEFGVAGGNGLVALETAAERVEARFGVGIEVHGFDTGRGLPPPTDFRDLPHLYRHEEYKMDFDKLQARLRRARLHLGLVSDTVRQFVRSKPAPIGFASFDLDLYCSTMDAFLIFQQGAGELTLPRVHCYFDDIMGLSYSEYTGERRAIEDFNATHECRKIAPIFGLKYFLPPMFNNEQWVEMFYLAHMFDHPLFNVPDGLTLEGENPLVGPASRLAPAAMLLNEFLASGEVAKIATNIQTLS
jgi:hypothetical protein